MGTKSFSQGNDHLQVFEELDLTRKEDVSEELKPHRIKQNSKDLNRLLQAVVDTMNPFSNDINKDYLFNISTGKATSVETANYLINVKAYEPCQNNLSLKLLLYALIT